MPTTALKLLINSSKVYVLSLLSFLFNKVTVSCLESVFITGKQCHVSISPTFLNPLITTKQSFWQLKLYRSFRTSSAYFLSERLIPVSPMLTGFLPVNHLKVFEGLFRSQERFVISGNL